MKRFGWHLSLTILLPVFLVAIFPLVDPKAVLHNRHYGCDSCDQQICGQSTCTSCSSGGEDGAKLWQKPENMCYAWPRDSSGHMKRKSSCRKDADCHLWQVCLYIYQNEEDFINWRNEKGYCVDTIRFNSIEDIKQGGEENQISPSDPA